jgi:hypothetical protein
VVLVHDSAACPGGADLAQTFAGSGLEQGAHIGFREPYVGVIDASGRRFERVGERGGHLVVRLQEADAG